MLKSDVMASEVITIGVAVEPNPQVYCFTMDCVSNVFRERMVLVLVVFHAAYW